jgi:hypothetical protein
MVRPKYLAERSAWTIHPCNQCGLSELFDAPSDLIKKVFPDLPAGQIPQMFTAFRGACGGAQVAELAGGGEVPRSVAEPRKKWWSSGSDRGDSVTFPSPQAPFRR